MRYNNEQLGHAWAYDVTNKRLQSYSGNMWAEGDYCYSYSTCIAYKIPLKRVLLLTLRNHSNTTIKHKHALMSAFSHYEVIEVPEEYIDRPKLAYEWYQERLESMMENNINYPKNKQGVLKLIDDRRLFKQYLGNALGLTASEVVKNTPEQRNAFDRYFVYNTQCENYNKERDIKREEQAEARRKARQARIDKAVAELREHLSNEKKLTWSEFVKAARTAIHGDGYRQHYYSINFYNLLRGFFNLENKAPYECYWAFIWREGSKVKTSKGVTVDWREVEMLLKRWKAGKPVLGLKAGIYTITHIDQEVVKIGCHNIPIANLEALYKEEIENA